MPFEIHDSSCEKILCNHCPCAINGDPTCSGAFMVAVDGEQLKRLCLKTEQALRNAMLNAPGCDGAFAILPRDYHELAAALQPFRQGERP